MERHPPVPPGCYFFKQINEEPYRGEYEFFIGPQMPSIVINGACLHEKLLISYAARCAWEDLAEFCGCSLREAEKNADAWEEWGNK